MSGKFYWLKLKRDFFKRHDIRIVEAMPNGKDYILFYLKLLCESVDHNGELRFNDSIPYNEEMLSTITDTNVDVVRSAIKIFVQLDMIEILDDGTLYMAEVQKMIGSAVDNDNANRQRAFRERQRQMQLDMPAEKEERYASVTKSNESKNKSKNKNKNINTIDRFEEFWKVYPKKVSKVSAQKAFEKKCDSEDTFKKIMEGLNKVIELDWSTRDSQYIPYPATWLNQERWNDDVKEAVRKTADIMPAYMTDSQTVQNVATNATVSDIQNMIKGLGGNR